MNRGMLAARGNLARLAVQRIAGAGTVGALILGLGPVGCASGNAPEMTSAATQTLLLRATGTWNVNNEYSEPVSMALEPIREIYTHVPGPDAETDQGFFPVGRDMDITRSNQAQRPDRTAMREVVMMTGKRPDRVVLALGADQFEIQYDDGPTWTVPVGGGRITEPGQLVDTRLRIVWEEGGSPTLEREVPNGGMLRDNFQVLSDGRLIVTRQAVFSGEVWQPTRFVYTKER